MDATPEYLESRRARSAAAAAEAARAGSSGGEARTPALLSSEDGRTKAEDPAETTALGGKGPADPAKLYERTWSGSEAPLAFIFLEIVQLCSSS